MSTTSTLFVVEDDTPVTASIQALFIDSPFDVETYESAETFLAAYDTDRHGCLILDVRLPGMDGLQLQQVLKLRGATIRIIMISGHADDELISQARSNGVALFLTKPFSGKDLHDTVCRMLT